MPITVGGCVNVITGDFFFRETDLVDVSYFPLEFQCFYDSGSSFFSEFGLGMGCNFPVELSYFFCRKDRQFRLDNETQGQGIYFDYLKDNLENQGSVFDGVFKHGYIDCLKSPLGAANSVRNMVFNFIRYSYKDKEDYYGTWNVKLPNGSKRKYEYYELVCDKCIKTTIDYTPYVAEGRHLLEREEFPDGNVNVFGYVHSNRNREGDFPPVYFIDKVEKYDASQKHRYSSLEFKYGDNFFVLKNSKGQEVKYEMTSFKSVREKLPMITHISGDHIIDTEYETTHNSRWDDKHPYNAFKYTKIKRPEGRYLQILYEGQKKEKNRGRVVRLEGPIGEDGSNGVKYKFEYDKNVTTVIDALGHKEKYIHSNEDYLIEHLIYDKNSISWKEKFLWGKDNNAGRLLAYATVDDNDNVRQFPGCKNVEEFAHYIKKIMKNPTEIKELSKGRRAYWHDSSKTVVIYDPCSIDAGTEFKPNIGKSYFDKLW